MTQATHITEREQYLQDCRETDKPWERWEFCDLDGQWYSCITEPGWDAARQYRRKQEPKKYIRIGDAIVPAPIKKASDGMFWVLTPALDPRRTYIEDTVPPGFQRKLLDNGIAYATEADAQQVADALRKLLTQTPFTLDATPKVPKPVSMMTVPTPLQEKPALGAHYYVVVPSIADGVSMWTWRKDDSQDAAVYGMGLVFDTREKAEQAVAIIRNLFRPQAA